MENIKALEAKLQSIGAQKIYEMDLTNITKLANQYYVSFSYLGQMDYFTYATVYCLSNLKKYDIPSEELIDYLQVCGICGIEKEDIHINKDTLQLNIFLKKVNKLGKMSVEQCEEIREGLEAGIDVYLYASEEYTPEQMQYIRIQLERAKEFGIKYAETINIIAHPKYTVKQMQVMAHAVNNINPPSDPYVLMKYADIGLSEQQLLYVSNFTTACSENGKMMWSRIKPYFELGYSDKKMSIIVDAVRDLSPDDWKEFEAFIRDFDEDGLTAILSGIKLGLNYKLYAKKEYSSKLITNLFNVLEECKKLNIPETTLFC